MAEENDKNESVASLNGDSDLEGKTIIDSNGLEIGKCKAVIIGDDGQIGFTFETEINGKAVVPSKTIPYSAIGKITDVIELRVPINFKIIQSHEEIKQIEKNKEVTQKETVKEEPLKEEKEDDVKPSKPEKKVEDKTKTVKTEVDKDTSKINVKIPVEKEKLVGSASVDTPQADATEQLSKALPENSDIETKEKASVIEEKTFSVPKIKNLMDGLEESVKKIDRLFKLISEGTAEEKIEAIKALTHLTKISPELGLSLIPKMLLLSDEQQQEVRLAVAEQLEILGENNPELFNDCYLEVLENAYDEPIDEVRELLAKTLHNIANKAPEIASKDLEEFLEEVIIGKRVPEVPAKVLHDATLKVVSGNFQLTRIAIRVRLKFIMKGGKLAERSVEELEDYNATLIGLTLIESFTIKEAEKIIKNTHFKKLGPVFIEVIDQMINAYKDGSFTLLNEVVDKKIEIPITVIERFYEVKIKLTLEGVKNVPMEVFLENPFVSQEEAEQIVYRLVVQKRVNAAIDMSNGKTFITTFVSDETADKPKATTKKTTKKTTPKKTSPKKSTKKTTSTSKKTSSTTKKSTTSKKSTTAKKTTSKKSTGKKPSKTSKKSTSSKKTTTAKKTSTKKPAAKKTKSKTTTKKPSSTKSKSKTKKTTTTKKSTSKKKKESQKK